MKLVHHDDPGLLLRPKSQADYRPGNIFAAEAEYMYS